MLTVRPYVRSQFSNLTKQNNRKQWSLLARLLVWPSGSLVIPVLLDIYLNISEEKQQKCFWRKCPSVDALWAPSLNSILWRMKFKLIFFLFPGPYPTNFMYFKLECCKQWCEKNCYISRRHSAILILIDWRHKNQIQKYVIDPPDPDGQIGGHCIHTQHTTTLNGAWWVTLKSTDLFHRVFTLPSNGRAWACHDFSFKDFEGPLFLLDPTFRFMATFFTFQHLAS